MCWEAFMYGVLFGLCTCITLVVSVFVLEWRSRGG